MPVFYFDTEINGGGRSRDQEGIPLPDVDAAKHEAITALYCLAREIEPEIGPRRISMYVRDRSDREIFETALDMTVVHK